MIDDIELPDVEVRTMNEVLGVEDITLMGKLLAAHDQSQAPFYPYIDKTMDDEWNRNDLQIFLDVDDYYTGYDITVAATDMTRFILPKHNRDPKLYEESAKRSMFRVERMLQSHQVRRSLKLMSISGFETDRDVYIPADVEKPITFVPFDEWRDVHRGLANRGEAFKPVNSTMYEVFKNVGILR